MKPCVLAFVATALASPIAAARDQPGGPGRAADPEFPKMLDTDGLRKLYGEKELSVVMQGERGPVAIQAYPDGRLFGQSPMATLGNKDSSGKWRIDAAANKVCHEWQKSSWTNRCMMIRQTGPDTFEYTGASDKPGTKFTVQR